MIHALDFGLNNGRVYSGSPHLGQLYLDRVCLSTIVFTLALFTFDCRRGECLKAEQNGSKYFYFSLKTVLPSVSVRQHLLGDL